MNCRSLEIVFDTHGNPKQKLCVEYWLDKYISDIVYGGSKGSGKSYLGVSLIFGDAFLYPGTHYFIARKKLNDIRKFTIPSIHEVFNHWGITAKDYRYNGQDNVYELSNGSRVYLIQAKYEPSDPLYMRFGSMQMTRGWIEEAGEFEIEAKENLHASIGRWKNDVYNLPGKLLQTCNPSKNYLYKDYYKKNKAGELEAYKRFIQALPEDNKMLPAGYLENLNRILSPTQKQRLLYGNWEYDDDPTTLCDYNSICDIFSNVHVQHGKKYITADIARFGSDKGIVAVWSGWRVLEFMIVPFGDLTIIQNGIMAFKHKYSVPNSHIIADEDGVGGGVVDNLRILGFVNNSSALPGPIDPATGKPKDENFFNLQSQCCYNLAKKINAAGIYIECGLSDKHQEEIIEELEQLKSFDNDGIKPLRILPKEKIKGNIGRSPDWRDVLMMRAYFEYTAVKKNIYTVR